MCRRLCPAIKTVATCAMACGMLLGIALGHAVHLALVQTLGPEGMYELGWRVAFWLGGLLGVVGFIIRSQFQETASFLEIKRQGQLLTAPAKEVMTNHLSEVLIGSLAIMANGLNTIMFLVFLPLWSARLFPDHERVLTGLGMVTSCLAGFLCLVFGYCLDRGYHSIIKVAFGLLV